MQTIMYNLFYTVSYRTVTHGFSDLFLISSAHRFLFLVLVFVIFIFILVMYGN